MKDKPYWKQRIPAFRTTRDRAVHDCRFFLYAEGLLSESENNRVRIRISKRIKKANRKGGVA